MTFKLLSLISNNPNTVVEAYLVVLIVVCTMEYPVGKMEYIQAISVANYIVPALKVVFDTTQAEKEVSRTIQVELEAWRTTPTKVLIYSLEQILEQQALIVQMGNIQQVHYFDDGRSSFLVLFLSSATEALHCMLLSTFSLPLPIDLVCFQEEILDPEVDQSSFAVL